MPGSGSWILCPDTPDGCGLPGSHRRWQRRSGVQAGDRPVPGGRVRHGESDAAAGRVLLDADEPYYHRLFESRAQGRCSCQRPGLAVADSKFPACVAARTSRDSWGFVQMITHVEVTLSSGSDSVVTTRGIDELGERGIGRMVLAGTDGRWSAGVRSWSVRSVAGRGTSGGGRERG